MELNEHKSTQQHVMEILLRNVELIITNSKGGINLDWDVLKARTDVAQTFGHVAYISPHYSVIAWFWRTVPGFHSNWLHTWFEYIIKAALEG